jgi:peptidoglycan hydrolase-like protein with peptidoglycan-binding domain
MATYLRPADPRRSALRVHNQLLYGKSRRRGPLLAGAGLLAVVAILGALAAYFATARVTLPAGGGKIVRVTVTGATADLIPVRLSGDPAITPTVKIPAGERVTVRATIRRPGWISWLSGSTEHLKLTLTTPVARPAGDFFTLRARQPLRVRFTRAVSAIAYGRPGHMHRETLAHPEQTVAIPHSGLAGTVDIAGVPRAWESARAELVSWFPAGSAASAVASPAPGATITPHTTLHLTFSKPLSSVLHGHLPLVSPAGAGRWRVTSSHSIEFVPGGYGYGLGAHVTVALPSAVRLLGGHAGASTVGAWNVPTGSTLRLQQLLSQLGYLPFKVSGVSVADNPLAQEQAAIHPPSATLSWKYPNVPSRLRALWAPGAYGVMTRGAVMAFENDHGMSADGVDGAAVWKALITAADAGQVSHFGYTFVQVSEGSPETESTWHSGRTVVSGLVNTGIAAAPTATGVYPVFEHLPVTTMTGVNPDGTPYSDPGIQWTSYFNGGDALHEFPRGGYGYPQSLGCVEMPLGEAAAVYPYTPIGTLVDVY